MRTVSSGQWKYINNNNNDSNSIIERNLYEIKKTHTVLLFTTDPKKTFSSDQYSGDLSVDQLSVEQQEL